MPTLEQITETGIFGEVGDGISREFVPFNEELTAQMFADAINSGAMKRMQSELSAKTFCIRFSLKTVD